MNIFKIIWSFITRQWKTNPSVFAKILEEITQKAVVLACRKEKSAERYFVESVDVLDNFIFNKNFDVNEIEDSLNVLKAKELDVHAVAFAVDTVLTAYATYVDKIVKQGLDGKNALVLLEGVKKGIIDGLRDVSK